MATLAALPVLGCAGGQDRPPPTAILDDILQRAAPPLALVPRAPPDGGTGPDTEHREPRRFLSRPDRTAEDSSAGGPAEGGEEMVTLNFVQAEVTEVVRSILGELLDEPFTVVSEVEGAITIQSTEPVPASSALAVLEEALRVNGGALVRSEGVYTIVPLAQAAGRAPVRVGRGAGPVRGFRVTVLPVRHVGAAQVAEVIRPVLPEDRLLRAGPDGRSILFGGTEQETATVSSLVDIFDRDWLSNMNFSIFPLENARPSALVADLEPVLSQPGAASVAPDAAPGAAPGGPADATAAGVRLVPVDRMDAVIIVSPTRRALFDAERWLRALDVESRDGEPRLYVYKPGNGQAEALAEALRALFDAAATAPREPPDNPLEPGRAPALLGGSAVASDLETPPEAAPAVPAPATRRAVGGDGVRIFADADQNALFIRATPREYALIREAVEQLDVPPRQVLVEATVAEVTLTDELRYGLQWFFRSGDATVALSNGQAAVPQQAFPGFSVLLDTTDARVVLNALDDITDVNVVSSPQILVLDNQAARLQVGDQVPVATQTVRSVVDPDAPITNTIQYRDTGVILEVRPRITSGEMVVLNIRQEVSDVAVTRTSGIDSPTIQQRNLASTVAVRSGQTIALGGLIRGRRERGRSGVPLLSDIPVAGALFGSRVDRDDRTELLVLLTPRVVETTREADLITRDLRDRMRRMRDFRPFDAGR